MPLTSDQKKHLLIGGGVGALAALVGSAIFGGRKDHAPSLHLPHEAHGDHGEYPRRHASQDAEGRGENERGEYGPRKHKHHHHDHERERGHGD